MAIDTSQFVVTDEDRYLFDLQGFLVLRGVLSPQEVGELNAVVDQHQDEIDEIELLRNMPRGGTAELSESDRQRLVARYRTYKGPMQWDEGFRRLLDHPRVMPYLQEWIDPALRLDHYYGIFSETGKKAHTLHLGATPHNRAAYYHVSQGRIFSGLTVVSWALADMPAGQGCFACVPGSHRSNFPLPHDFATFARNPGCVAEVPMQAGDAVMFTEALTHGAYPWTAPHRRRSVLFKYSPGHMSWGYTDWPEELTSLFTPAQRRLFEPPYVQAGRANTPSGLRATFDDGAMPAGGYAG